LRAGVLASRNRDPGFSYVTIRLAKFSNP